jgi:hypothetical protein
MIMEKRDGGGRTSPKLEGRNGSVWRAVTIYQRTHEDVADEFGISSSRVGQIVDEVRASIPTVDLDKMRRQSIELYAELTNRALEIVDLVPAPIFVGKDGQIAYDDNGEVVRDYSGRIRAIETAAKMQEHTRKLMGLDSAMKAEISGAVRYEIVGVQPEELS